MHQLLDCSGLKKATYYYYLNTIGKDDKYQEVKERIEQIFRGSNRTYGYRRVKLALKNFFDIKLAYKTVRKLMNELRIVCKVRKKKYRYISRISNKIVPNVLQRDFTADRPNIKWVTDVTEFRIHRKKLYLSVIQDLYNGEIVAYAISRAPDQKLILDSLRSALDPNMDLTELLIHSDQGVLYQSPKYRNFLKKSHILQSMSSKGNCYDNAVVESFFGTLKCETIYLNKIKTLGELISTIEQYIEWYNHERIKLTLNGYSPIQYRLKNEQKL